MEVDPAVKEFRLVDLEALVTMKLTSYRRKNQVHLLNMLGDERITLEDEPPAVAAEWRLLTDEESFSSKIWNDAFLAAFAKTAALELVTFDRGFRRYPGLRLRLLEP